MGYRLFAVRVSERVYRIPVGALAAFERGIPSHRPDRRCRRAVRRGAR